MMRDAWTRSMSNGSRICRALSASIASFGDIVADGSPAFVPEIFSMYALAALRVSKNALTRVPVSERLAGISTFHRFLDDMNMGSEIDF